MVTLVALSLHRCLPMKTTVKPYAVISYGQGSYGPGWYYSDKEYPEEGCVGAFRTRKQAVKHAEENGYRTSPS